MSLTDALGSLTGTISAPNVLRRAKTHDLMALEDVPQRAWTALAEQALEPNPFYDPDWARAVSAHARGRSGAQALVVWDSVARRRLIGLLPVKSAWRSLKLPLPMLVAWRPYAPLATPLLHADAPDDAIHGLLDAAVDVGARALLVPFVTQGITSLALRGALAERGLQPRMLHAHPRAFLDARNDAEPMLREALGAKKLKELRRQRNRLADDGAVTFAMAEDPAEVAIALDAFLALESRGWKGSNGTAMAQHDGDTRFIRQAALALAQQGRFGVARLLRGDDTIAAGLVLRQGRRACFFKIAYDETLAKLSPGVQLTLELTRHFCADPRVDSVDSTADANHPMIDHLWRDRMELADVFIPTRHGDRLVAPLARQIVTAERQARDLVRPLVHRLRALGASA